MHRRNVHFKSESSRLQFETSMCTARWPLRHAALPHNYTQISPQTKHFRWRYA